MPKREGLTEKIESRINLGLAQVSAVRSRPRTCGVDASDVGTVLWVGVDVHAHREPNAGCFGNQLYKRPCCNALNKGIFPNCKAHMVFAIGGGRKNK